MVASSRIISLPETPLYEKPLARNSPEQPQPQASALSPFNMRYQGLLAESLT